METKSNEIRARFWSLNERALEEGCQFVRIEVQCRTPVGSGHESLAIAKAEDKRWNMLPRDAQTCPQPHARVYSNPDVASPSRRTCTGLSAHGRAHDLIDVLLPSLAYSHCRLLCSSIKRLHYVVYCRISLLATICTYTSSRASSRCCPRLETAC